MGFTSCEMLLWLLFVGFLQASVASSFRGFWDGFDASNLQHVSGDQSQPHVAFYPPRSNSWPWPQVQGSQRSPQATSGHFHPQAPCFQSKPQRPNYWPFPVPQEPVPVFQSSEPGDLPQVPGYSPSNQPTPAPQPQQPDQQPQAAGVQALPPNNAPPRRLPESWYQKRPQYLASRFPSKPLPPPRPQGPNPLPQRPSTVLHPWSQQQPGNWPQPAPTTLPPTLPPTRPSNPAQALRPLPQSHSKLFHPWHQQRHQLLNNPFKPQPPAPQQPTPQPPSAPTPQSTPATQEPGPSNNLPQAQPPDNLPHPWYQSPIYLLNPHHYPWFLPHPAPSTPQSSPAPPSNPPQAPLPPSTTQQPASSTQLPQESGPVAQLPSDTPQPSPPSNLLHVPDQPLPPWYQHQSPSLVQPHWPLIPGYLPEPVSYQPQYWPYGPSNLPPAWSWFPMYPPWTSFTQSCKPPLLCYELSSDSAFYPYLLPDRETGSVEP
ncbi:uncharacterized protein LOC114862057 isoform X2 [Betta splendens]|uniref:Uncharacterized protein LOC114862057 isoform X2 n=1 Tax=Betta splendens TaxID=158456 RepID=A0A6P7NJT1_BETSP|nr:uncharacterized protein LOC114862057 isoform X2 [Betta splendens]